MNIILFILFGIVYLVVGRVIAEKKWEWSGYDLYCEDIGITLTTLFWPIYLMGLGIKLLAGIFVDID